ncbi:MAG: 6,7-dimethyl-8-ribityllumazine synthase [Minisyncoccia bacterium]
MQIKNKTYEYFDGRKLRVGIVMARFNHEITGGLLNSALAMLKKNKIVEENVKVVFVAGAVEIPFALHKLAKSKKYDFLVAIGCVIRGETPHFDFVCKMAQEGILKVMLEDNIPVGFGVLSVNNLKQAQARYHVGGEAVLAALELALMK